MSLTGGQKCIEIRFYEMLCFQLHFVTTTDRFLSKTSRMKDFPASWISVTLILLYFFQSIVAPKTMATNERAAVEKSFAEESYAESYAVKSSAVRSSAKKSSAAKSTESDSKEDASIEPHDRRTASSKGLDFEPEEEETKDPKEEKSSNTTTLRNDAKDDQELLMHDYGTIQLEV